VNAGRVPTVVAEVRRNPTREEFFARPLHWYWMGDRPVPDEWITAAWEELTELRESVTGYFAEQAEAHGDLGQDHPRFKHLAGILPISRMVELYERIRERAPQREREFRPNFARLFRERLSLFPSPRYE
jgi:hypothetical protein